MKFTDILSERIVTPPAPTATPSQINLANSSQTMSGAARPPAVAPVTRNSKTPAAAPAAKAPAAPAAKAPAAPAATTARPAANLNYKGTAGAQAIQQANPDAIKNVNQIKAGQTINLPGGGTYQVKKGDTLDKIARQQGGGKSTSGEQPAYNTTQIRNDYEFPVKNAPGFDNKPAAPAAAPADDGMNVPHSNIPSPNAATTPATPTVPPGGYGSMNPRDAAAAYSAELQSQGKPGLEPGAGVVSTGTNTALTSGSGKPVTFRGPDQIEWENRPENRFSNKPYPGREAVAQQDAARKEQGQKNLDSLKGLVNKLNPFSKKEPAASPSTNTAPTNTSPTNTAPASPNTAVAPVSGANTYAKSVGATTNNVLSGGGMPQNAFGGGNTSAPTPSAPTASTTATPPIASANTEEQPVTTAESELEESDIMELSQIAKLAGLDEEMLTKKLKEAKMADIKGKKHTGKYGKEYDTDEEGDEKEKKAEPAAKQGRGRPKKDSNVEAGKYKGADDAAKHIIGGKAPKGKSSLPSKKHTLKDWIDSAEEMIAERAKNKYAIGMAAAKKQAGYGSEPAHDLPKSVVKKGHEIAKKIKEGGEQLPSPPDEVHLPKKGSKHGPVDVYRKKTNETEQKTMSRAAKGHEKYGKEGMQALAKAGREGASEKKLDAIRKKHDKYDNLDEGQVNEGYFSDNVGKMGIFDIPEFGLFAYKRSKFEKQIDGNPGLAPYKKQILSDLESGYNKFRNFDKAKEYALEYARYKIDQQRRRDGMVPAAGAMEEGELKGGQKKLDVAEPKGKLDAKDFAALRSKKKVKEGEDQLNELSPDTLTRYADKAKGQRGWAFGRAQAGKEGHGSADPQGKFDRLWNKRADGYNQAVAKGARDLDKSGQKSSWDWSKDDTPAALKRDKGQVREGINFAEMMRETQMSIDEMLMELQGEIEEYKRSGNMGDKLRDALDVHKYNKKLIDAMDMGAPVEESLDDWQQGEICYYRGRKGKVDRQEGGKIFVHVAGGNMDVWPASQCSREKQSLLSTIGKDAKDIGKGMFHFATGEKFGKEPVDESPFAFAESKNKEIDMKDLQIESWEKSLADLLNENITITTTSGDHGDDSITVNATDHDAHEVMALIRNAGLAKIGAGGDEEIGEPEVNNYGLPMHDEPDMEISMEPEHEPEAHMISVDGPGQDDKEGDDILSLIKKMLGGEESSASPVASGEVSDYEEEGPEDSEETSDDSEESGETDSEEDSEETSDDSEESGEEDSEENSEEDESEDDEEKVKEAYGQADEGNMFTGNLAKARAAGKEEADLDGDGDMEKVHEGEGMCSECGMSESMCGHSDKVDESYANEDDDKAMQDLEYMMRVISGGLNREKRDQTTLPHTSVKVSESDDLAQFKKLSGI